MDLLKIGRFIAECRKRQNLTQMQLAQKLCVTDKAVSKWERGMGMPDSSLMLSLCEALDITLNDLLHGEIVADQREAHMENRLLEMVKERELADRRLLKLEIAIGVLSAVVIFVPVFLGALLPLEEEWMQTVIALSGLVPGVIGFAIALRMEQVAGYYECHHCGHRYVPTYYAVTRAQHLGRTRRLRCPRCGKKSWQRKVLDREPSRSEEEV